MRRGKGRGEERRGGKRSGGVPEWVVGVDVMLDEVEEVDACDTQTFQFLQGEQRGSGLNNDLL